jgi:hypothetical protein
MGWPWISGPETELVGKSGFRISRTFLWGSMLIKALQHSGGYRSLPATSQKPLPKNKQTNKKNLCSPPQKEFRLAW